MVREVVLADKKGKGSMVPAALVIVLDTIKIRRTGPATMVPLLAQPEGQVES